MVRRPCIGCIYFKACGSTTREEECKGRMTKKAKKEADKKEAKK